jgi:proteic killer suppression protein
VIRSFRDAEAEKLFHDQFSKRYQPCERTARRKLTMLDEAETLKDLAALPGTRLEALSKDRQGYSIRINDQFRICFTWEDGNADQVEIVDYH